MDERKKNEAKTRKMNTFANGLYLFNFRWQNCSLFGGNLQITVTSSQELGREIKNGQNEIIIEGNLSTKVVRIMATCSVAWAIAFGAVAVAVLAVLAAPAGIAAGAFGLVAESVIASIAATSATAAVAVWGLATTASAVGIGVGARSAGALKKMKEEYKIKCKTANSVTIIKK